MGEWGEEEVRGGGGVGGAGGRKDGSAGVLKEPYEDVNACLNIVSFSCPHFPFMVENANDFTSIIFQEPTIYGLLRQIN